MLSGCGGVGDDNSAENFFRSRTANFISVIILKAVVARRTDVYGSFALKVSFDYITVLIGDCRSRVGEGYGASCKTEYSPLRDEGERGVLDNNYAANCSYRVA